MITRFVLDDGGMNLLSSSALRALGSAVAQLHGCAVFVIESARPGIFAAGADMAEMSRFTPFEAYEFARLGQEVFADIERLPCLTVALIDGDCLGGALDLVLAFDFRFATPRARFAHPGARLGIVTGFGGTSRWRGVMSRPAAHQLFLANRVLSADEALSIGLADRVAESHDDEVSRLATLDAARAQFVKGLALHSARLTRSELLRLSSHNPAFSR